MKKGMSGCNSCTHPTCPHGMNSNGLSSCLECDLGILVLDPSAAPKWKLGCNRCDVIIHLFENAHKVTVDTDTCDCGAQLVTVEYKQVRKRWCWYNCRREYVTAFFHMLFDFRIKVNCPTKRLKCQAVYFVLQLSPR